MNARRCIGPRTPRRAHAPDTNWPHSQMSPTASRLRYCDRVTAVAAIALLIFLFFLKWYGYTGGTQSTTGVNVSAGESINGWHAFTINRWIWLLTAAVALISVAISAGVLVLESERPVRRGPLIAVLGLLSTLTILFRIVHHPVANPGIAILHASAGIKLGIWLGLIAAVAITYGGYLTMREEGLSLASLRSA